MSVKDHLPKHHTEILMKYDEYIEAWAELVDNFYNKACSIQEVQAVLNSGGDSAIKLSSALLVMLLVDGLRAWNIKKRLRAKVRGSVEEAIVRASAHRIFAANAEFHADDSVEFIDAIVDVYHSLADTFTQAFPLRTNDEQKDVIVRCVALASYVTDSCFDKQDSQYESLTQAIGIVLVEADSVFARLGAATTVDGNTMLFKHPRFIVMKS